MPLYYHISGGLLLDMYPNAEAAYSLRKLRKAYSGAAIRVRRSSDNTEKDIGFVNNILDTASLSSFVSTNSGYVTTWYDQTTNGRNAFQSTSGIQPNIVNAGTIRTGLNSKPVIYASTSNRLETTATSGNMNVDGQKIRSIFTVQNLETPQYQCALTFGTSNISRSLWQMYGKYTTNKFALDLNVQAIGSSTFSTNLLTTIVPNGITNASNIIIYGNGTLSNTNIAGINGVFSTENAVLRLLNNTDANSHSSVHEAIIWSIDQQTNRASIEGNINSFYSIW